NVDRSEVTLARAVDLRYEGQEHTVTLPIDADATVEAILADFHHAHERAYTFSLEVPVQFVNFHLTAHGPDNSSLEALHTASRDVTEAAPKGRRMVLFDRIGQVGADIYERRDLPSGV